jgi:hypothetical protein
LLQPALVILEDVDLIAGDRSFGPIGTNPQTARPTGHCASTPSR